MHTFGTIGQCHMYARCKLPRWCLSGLSPAVYSHPALTQPTWCRPRRPLPASRSAIQYRFEALYSPARRSSCYRGNFRGLVLGCIDATFGKQICVWKLSPRSTECTPLHSSAISIFVKKLQTFSLKFCKMLAKLLVKLAILLEILAIFSTKF